MQLLNSLENSFDNSLLRVKIELFLFPLIITILIIYYFQELTSTPEYKPVSSNVFIQERVMKKNFIEIIKDIEKYILTKEIEVINISSNENSIQLETKSNLVENIKLIYFLENYNNFSKIDYLKISTNALTISLSFDKFFIKNSNPLYKKQLKYLEEYKKYSNKFILKAIVGDMVLINDKWLKIEDEIENFKLIKITKDSVLIKNNQINLELGFMKNGNL